MAINFPIEIKGIDTLNKAYQEKGSMIPTVCGDYVSVRPCGSDYQDETYLGVYIGEISLGTSYFFDRESDGKLEVMHNNNPAIFVPDLNKVIFGCESWWGKINSEDDLKQITDQDIENVWYVKALKYLEGKNNGAD